MQYLIPLSAFERTGKGGMTAYGKIHGSRSLVDHVPLFRNSAVSQLIGDFQPEKKGKFFQGILIALDIKSDPVLFPFCHVEFHISGKAVLLDFIPLLFIFIRRAFQLPDKGKQHRGCLAPEARIGFPHVFLSRGLIHQGLQFSAKTLDFSSYLLILQNIPHKTTPSQYFIPLDT